jgi:hypothetical protein
LYGHAGRLTAESGGFRPGQVSNAAPGGAARRRAERRAQLRHLGLLLRAEPEGKTHRVEPKFASDAALSLKIPIRAFELIQILSQPCGISGSCYDSPASGSVGVAGAGAVPVALDVKVISTPLSIIK